ncbi:MAG: hypothetical protein HY746_02705 [Elusimicrobia bacterium]|nr:hypothetical protein [Elusimicrobiota bacterium]
MSRLNKYIISAAIAFQTVYFITSHVFASYTLNGTCRVTGFIYPGGTPCEVVFTFTSTPLSTLIECELYRSELDGTDCLVTAPNDNCADQNGYLLNSYCQGSGGGSVSGSDVSGFFPNGFGSLNPFWETGSPFFSKHYSTDFSEWIDDSRERWRSYLARNYIAKETGIAIWPNNPFATTLEWLYRVLKGLNKQTAHPASFFPSLDSSPATEEQLNYETDYLIPPEVEYKGQVEGPLAGSEDEITGNNNLCLGGMNISEGSISPSYGMFYNSVYGGIGETANMKIEQFPDGRVIFTDSSNTRWTYRPYGKFNPDASNDIHYRSPIGSASDLTYGKTGFGKGFKIQDTNGSVIEFSRIQENLSKPRRFNSSDGSYLTYGYDDKNIMDMTAKII